jgi:glycosyltransferase involved in cell wall biosynthesis
MRRPPHGENPGTAGFAAVIPAYNAAATVGSVVRGARAVLSEVLVVDDGSTDTTSLRAEEAGARVVAHGVNRGKGAALRTAFEDLRGRDLEGLITLDADGQHDPAEIPLLQQAYRLTGADLVIGSREQSFAAMSSARRFGNRFSSSAFAFFSGLRLPDSQSGFRLYSQSFLRSVTVRCNAYDAEMELLLKAVAGGFRVKSVALGNVVADGRAGSHYRPWRDTFRICRCVVGFWARRRLSGGGK